MQQPLTATEGNPSIKHLALKLGVLHYLVHFGRGCQLPLQNHAHISSDSGPKRSLVAPLECINGVEYPLENGVVPSECEG